MGLYCIHFRSNLLNGDGENLPMKKIFDIYITFIQIGQSEHVYQHVFASLRAFINNYSTLLFQGMIFFAIEVARSFTRLLLQETQFYVVVCATNY